MKTRKIFYVKLLKMWNLQEEEIRKYSKFQKRVKITNTEKMKYLKEHLLKSVKKYSQNYVKFTKKLSDFKKRESFFWTETPLESITREKPKKISLAKVFSNEVIAELIAKCQQDKEFLKKKKSVN